MSLLAEESSSSQPQKRRHTVEQNGSTRLNGHRPKPGPKRALHRGVTKRLQFEFPEAAIHTLKELAARTGQPTMAGVLRDALKLYAWILAEQEQDRRIISEDRRGQQRRELLPLLEVPSR
jgi:hypothetical protein